MKRIVLLLLFTWFSFSSVQAQVTSALVDNALLTGSTGTSSTITGATFGTAFAGRVIVVPLWINHGAADESTVTIGGVTAVLTTVTSQGGVLASAVVPTGTTGNIVATSTDATNQVQAIGVIALTGASSATPSATITNPSAGTGTINVPASGSVVAFSAGLTAGTWVGVTVLLTDTSDGFPITSASFDNSGGAITGLAVSYSTGIVLGAAAFTPSSGPSPGGTYRALSGVGK